MKSIFLAIIPTLTLINPASAVMVDFTTSCKEAKGLFVESEVVHNISVLPYQRSDGVNVLAQIETKPIKEIMYSKQFFYIIKNESLELALKAYDTLKYIDICYKYGPDYDANYIVGLRMRDE